MHYNSMIVLVLVVAAGFAAADATDDAVAAAKKAGACLAWKAGVYNDNKADGWTVETSQDGKTLTYSDKDGKEITDWSVYDDYSKDNCEPDGASYMMVGGATIVAAMISMLSF